MYRLSSDNITLIALPPDAPRPKVNDLVADIRDLWKSMTKEAQYEATEDELARLEERKEMKKSTEHSMALNAFHDARANLASIQHQV
jgi:hypothetical protein